MTYSYHSKSVMQPDGHVTKYVKEKQGGVVDNNKIYEVKHGFKDSRSNIERVCHERVLNNDGYKHVKSRDRDGSQEE